MKFNDMLKRFENTNFFLTKTPQYYTGFGRKEEASRIVYGGKNE